MAFQVAIDGPAGAGKSTISRAAAEKLGFLYIDTGAMYRAVGYKAKVNNIAFDDEKSLSDMANATDIRIKREEDGQHIIMDGADVTSLIRTPEISMAASRVSAVGGVRKALVELQRKIAGENDVIMDGRDIASTVLPNANVKIFLTASVEDRAERRYAEMLEKGQKADLNAVRSDIEQRDNNDMNRKVSPLRKAEDAELIDTSGNTLSQSVDTIINYIGRYMR